MLTFIDAVERRGMRESVVASRDERDVGRGAWETATFDESRWSGAVDRGGALTRGTRENEGRGRTRDEEGCRGALGSADICHKIGETDRAIVYTSNRTFWIMPRRSAGESSIQYFTAASGVVRRKTWLR